MNPAAHIVQTMYDGLIRSTGVWWRSPGAEHLVTVPTSERLDDLVRRPRRIGFVGTAALRGARRGRRVGLSATIVRGRDVCHAADAPTPRTVHLRPGLSVTNRVPNDRTLWRVQVRGGSRRLAFIARRALSPRGE